jgi:energy-coupling factor transporter ATP-binding protein EcfA2
MKLEKLILVNWGALRSGEYMMGNLTLLTGPTGSGKSTMLDALQTLMTATHHNLFSYNPGQDETTQSSRSGKSKRTLWSYIVGAEDNLFARPFGAHGYIAAVFKPSEDEDAGKPFTALIGAAAKVDGSGDRRQAIQEKLVLIIVDNAELSFDNLILSVKDAEDEQVVPVETIEHHLKRTYPQVTNFHETKKEYLCQLYGRFRGLKTVPAREAEAAAKAWSQSIAHKPIGSVDDLVKNQILEYNPQEFGHRITQISDMMRQMHNLREEGERLDANVAKLELIGDSIQFATTHYEKAVQYQLLASKRSLLEDARQIDEADKASRVLRGKITDETLQIESLTREIDGHHNSLVSLEAQLRGIPAATEKQRIEERLAEARLAASKATTGLAVALEAADALVTKSHSVLGMQFPASSRELEAATSSVAEALSAVRDKPLSLYRDNVTMLQADNLRPASALAVVRLLERLEGSYDTLHQALAGTQDSFLSAVQQRSATLSFELESATEKEAELAERKANLAAGGTDYPNETRHALKLFREELPGAKVQVLCDLIEPKDQEWQPAIEGYMSNARFNLIVDEAWEAEAIEFSRRRCSKVKVIQGSLCLKHAKPNMVPSESIINELHTEHPIAKAYLVEQFGQVVKVYSVDSLRFTPRGVMKDGKAAGSRTLFNADAFALVFGKEAQRIAREKVVAAHEQAETLLRSLRQQSKDMKGLLGLLSGLTRPSFSATVELERAANEIDTGETDLTRLDLKEVEKLEADKAALGLQIKGLDDRITAANQRIGGHNTAIQGHADLALKLERGLEAKERQVEQDTTRMHGICLVNDALSFTTLEREIDEQLESRELTPHQIQATATTSATQANLAYADLREEVAGYNQYARVDEQLHGVHSEGQRSDDFGPVYGAIVALRARVKEQLDIQREVGIRQNLGKLRQAEASFKDVFTKQFCYEIRNAVDSGVKTLKALNHELANLKFGTDKFRIDWDSWVTEFKGYYDFFTAAHNLSEVQEAGDLFSAENLDPELAKVRDKLTELLLSNDQDRAQKELQRIADFRNYRRYEIWKESDSGSKVALSEWGTGSGGQLETPAYIVRAAVVTNRLKHFDKGPNLKLLVNDESFAKMDERRAHDVIRFIRDSLGIQLICAMPTKHAGALKSEFTKEWSFTRTQAEENGEVDFISEADERDLNPDKLQELWDERRRQVRLQAQIAFEAEEAQAKSPAEVPA